MSMKEYLYHAQAFGVDADITDPGPYKLDGHGKCVLPPGKTGSHTNTHTGFTMPGGLSHGAIATEVNAMPEDKDGFFRTEVRSTIHNLRVDGKSILSVDVIKFGLVSVYCRDWFERPESHPRRTRVLPMDCSFENLTLNGAPLDPKLPAPFHYSADRRENYLHGKVPEPAVDTEVRHAILGSLTRSMYIPNFGRIFFGEWTLLPNEKWHTVHQIVMLRMAFSSPPSGSGTGGGGQGDGSSGGDGGG